MKVSTVYTVPLEPDEVMYWKPRGVDSQPILVLVMDTYGDKATVNAVYGNGIFTVRLEELEPAGPIQLVIDNELHRNFPRVAL